MIGNYGEEAIVSVVLVFCENLKGYNLILCLYFGLWSLLRVSHSMLGAPRLLYRLNLE